MKKTTNVLAAVAVIGMFLTFTACSKTTDSAPAPAGFTASRMTKALDLTEAKYEEIQSLKGVIQSKVEAYPKGSVEARMAADELRALTAAEKITKDDYDFGKTAGKDGNGPSKIETSNLLAETATAAKNNVTPGEKKLPTDSNAEGMEGVTVEWTAVSKPTDNCYTDKPADQTHASIMIKDENKADHKCECTIQKAKDNSTDGTFQLHATISCGGYKCTVTCGAGVSADAAKFKIKH